MKREFLFFFALTASAIGQGAGPLVPPGGPADGTYRTLGELWDKLEVLESEINTVEPRTDVLSLPGNATAEHVISAPGSYFLSGDLDVGETNGIEVRADYVTIDLGGFDIRRSGGGGGAAIDIDATSFHVRDGTIGAGQSFGEFNYGVRASAETRAGRLTKLTVLQTGIVGISAGSEARLSACSLRSSFGIGILAQKDAILDGCHVVATSGLVAISVGSGSIVRDSTVAESFNGNGFNGSDASVFERCTSSQNDGKGFQLGQSCVVSSCIATSNGGAGIETGTGSTLTACSARNNSGDGISTGASSTLSSCTASSNSGNHAILTGARCALQNCTASGNTTAYGIRTGQGSSLSNCTASGNFWSLGDSYGISAGDHNVLDACVTETNTNDNGIGANHGCGIAAGEGSKVSNCSASENSGDGIQVGTGSHVFNCHAKDNFKYINPNPQIGITAGLKSTGNFHVVGNRCRIEGNHSENGHHGFRVQGQENIIVKNTSLRAADGINFAIDAKNVYGRIFDLTERVETSGAVEGSDMQSTLPTAVAGNTDPWSNFAIGNTSDP